MSSRLILAGILLACAILLFFALQDDHTREAGVVDEPAPVETDEDVELLGRGERKEEPAPPSPTPSSGKEREKDPPAPAPTPRKSRPGSVGRLAEASGDATTATLRLRVVDEHDILRR